MGNCCGNETSKAEKYTKHPSYPSIVTEQPQSQSHDTSNDLDSSGFSNIAGSVTEHVEDGGRSENRRHKPQQEENVKQKTKNQKKKNKKKNVRTSSALEKKEEEGQKGKQTEGTKEMRSTENQKLGEKHKDQSNLAVDISGAAEGAFAPKEDNKMQSRAYLHCEMTPIRPTQKPSGNLQTQQQEQQQQQQQQHSSFGVNRGDELRQTTHEPTYEAMKKEKDKIQEQMKKIENEKSQLEKRCTEIEKKWESKLKAEEEMAKEMAKTFEVKLKDLQLENKQDKQSYEREISKLRNEKEKLVKEKDELLLRLSAMAGRKLTDNNPNIADLSDINRPTKLAEKFSEFYDNAWTDGFTALQEEYDFQDEEKAVTLLLNLLMTAYNLALKAATEQLKDLQRNLQKFNANADESFVADVLKQMKDNRKKVACPSKELKKEYAAMIHKTEPKRANKLLENKALKKYTDECLELCWLMVIQDPPLHLHCDGCQTGEKFDKNTFREYTQGGVDVDFPVWPAMCLEKGGALLAKGVVQCRKTPKTSLAASLREPVPKRSPEKFSQSLNQPKITVLATKDFDVSDKRVSSNTEQRHSMQIKSSSDVSKQASLGAHVTTIQHAGNSRSTVDRAINTKAATTDKREKDQITDIDIPNPHSKPMPDYENISKLNMDPMNQSHSQHLVKL